MKDIAENTTTPGLGGLSRSSTLLLQLVIGVKYVRTINRDLRMQLSHLRPSLFEDSDLHDIRRSHLLAELHEVRPLLRGFTVSIALSFVSCPLASAYPQHVFLPAEFKRSAYSTCLFK